MILDPHLSAKNNTMLCGPPTFAGVEYAINNNHHAWAARWLFAACMLMPLAAWADPAASASAPEQQSSLELGVGLSGLSFPDYPGSAETHKLLLPFPYIVYHGPHLDVENGRVLGIVLAGSRFSLDVDFSGSVAVQSSRDPERVGMPDLDWIGEAGPALRYHAWNSGDGEASLDAVLPVRVAVSARGLTAHHRGWAWAPRLEFDYDHGPPAQLLEFDASLTALFADAGLNDYVYGVTPQFATVTRPAFEPGSGYGGYNLNFGMSLHHDQLVYGCFLSYTNLNGAVFAGSPLVSRMRDVALGVAVSWVIKTE
jgi:outer membrane protein